MVQYKEYTTPCKASEVVMKNILIILFLSIVPTFSAAAADNDTDHQWRVEMIEKITEQRIDEIAAFRQRILKQALTCNSGARPNVTIIRLGQNPKFRTECPKSRNHD
jgi:hypothetical protein